MVRGAPSNRCPSLQKGAYSVVIVAVLGLLTLIASRVMTTATLDSVRLTNNTHASTESFYAAESALAEAIVWLETNTPTYSGGGTLSDQVTGTTVQFTTSTGDTDSQRDYTTTFWFENGGDRIRVFAQSTAGDNQALLSTWVDPSSPVNSPALDAPLTVAQCLLGTTGNPQVNADPGGGVSYTTIKTSSACTTDPIGTSCAGSPNGRRYGNLNCAGSAFTETIVDDTTGAGTDLWSSVFTTTRASLEASATNDSSSNIYWIESGDGLPSNEIAWDSASSSCTTPPAIVVIEGCPAPSFFTGGTRICGVVFIEPDPTAQDFSLTCDGNGWGNVHIYGTMIVNGNMDKLNANTEITAASIAGFDAGDFPSEVVIVPGTWTDLEVD